jgi:hypothetical protein
MAKDKEEEMKRMLYILTALTLITFVSTTATALVIDRIGLISRIRAHDSGSPFETDANWLKMEGVNSVGTCREHEGLILLKIKDNDRGKQQLSLAIAAFLANRLVEINIDDTYIDRRDGFCYLRSIDLFK